MGRKPCCSKVGMRKGAWTEAEDRLLTNYIELNGEGNWRSLPMKAGLLRCGKSCRLRWVNYLRPGIKRGNFSPEEDDLIIRLHTLLGGRWSLIAGRLSGRTDNEIKNYWNTYLLKKLKAAGIEPKAKTYYSIAKRTKASRVQKKYSTSTRQNEEKKRRKRAKNKTCNLLQQAEKSQGETEDCEVVEKIQVHRPKAIRLAKGYSSSSSFSSQSCSQDNAPKFNFPLSSEEVDNKKEEKIEDNAIYEKLQLFDKLLNGCDISTECSEQTSSCYMLEEVYKEYFQILSEI